MKNDPLTITINEQTYRLVSNSGSDVKIAVLQRGNVLVGRFTRDGDMCELTDASVIRRWGTKRGLGEISDGGPTSDTVLDPCGRVTFHILTAVMLIDCDAAEWAL